MNLEVKEEIANAITHGIGFILSISGFILLVMRAITFEDNLFLICAIIFGVSMILLYLCSTLLHSIHFKKTRKLFTILDHSAIYVLIAGTYTPFLLLVLEDTLGWILFFVVWSIAIGGIVFKSIFVDKYNVVSTIAYLIMGWLIVVAIKPIYHSLGTIGFILLLCGGVFYSLGTIFYLWEKLPFNHAIWHLFVLAGSFFMFVCVFAVVYA